MSNIANAIKSLNEKNNNNYEFIVRGNPTNQEEYNNQVDFITGSNENGIAIKSNTQLYTWSEIQTELPLVDYLLR